MDNTISKNLQEIQERIQKAAEECGRDPQSIRLVAVSKTKPAEMLRQAAAAGATIFGENYIQEAREKIAELESLDVEWHFIGHLQSNKAKYAVPLFSLIHSVDSFKLAGEIDKQAAKAGKIQDILVQVNISGEETKSGTADEEAATLVKEISALENVRVKGLMTMPPFFDDPDRARPFFRRLRELAQAIQNKGFKNVSMEELSMGMTGDFEAAIEEGATLVRVGTAIFGARNYN
ncbi:alanine racemase domain protein [Desulfatibacillum aliphaticivorans]|uniref:Pyridoxal phosphate homeostasis protein n=1 Tax=Desulfatibacillum aliphaticivorans TaxID=218208 RepID=B8FH15_DESAL|nr:YggS family pyridoxal phosphate-dependent enzyme [Desulfatibacillum aliphaticivorans]ACL02103.1 alanine racemase domain protein [Desulfatibacillum aliphaticivorans]